MRRLRQTIIIFISTFLLFSCSTKPDEKNKVYYIIKHQQEQIDLGKDAPPPPPFYKPFYGNYNFILLDSSKIFFHKKNKYYSCGYGLDHTKPFRLYLTPGNLVEIKINELEMFLKSIPDSIISDQHFYASVSSPKDTIRNAAYKIIAGYFKLKNIKHYNTRNLTEEEEYVLTAKLENKKYDPAFIDWKVGFGDGPFYLPTTDTTPKILFDKDKSFEIISSQRDITTESSSSDTNVCKGWAISAKELEKIIANSKSIDGHTWHNDFGVYPCIINGQLKQNEQIFRFEVNAGSWMYVFCPDTTLILGNYKKQDEKYFISNAWDGN